MSDVIKDFITSKQHTFDVDNLADIDPDVIHMELLKGITIGCKVPKPNVIILEPGNATNSNDNIEEVCLEYFKDLGICK